MRAGGGAGGECEWECGPPPHTLLVPSARTVDLRHIRDHYYGSHQKLNPYGIVPLAFPDDWTAPHGREAAVFPLPPK